MKNKKLNFNKLFYNNRFVLVFSIVAAIVLWLAVAIQLSPEEERVVENVKVRIELADYLKDAGYKAFGASDYYVDVTVKGKRYLVSPASLKSDDIVVKANTSFVDSAGSYSLQLIPSRLDEGDDFEIVSLSVNTIEVYFDTEKKQEFPIAIDVTAPEGGIVPEGYYIEGGYKVTPNKIKISGPAGEINKIVEVRAKATVTDQLTTGQTLSGTVVALAYDGTEPGFLTYGNGKTDVSISVPVYKSEELRTTAHFENAPVYYIQHPFEVSVSPAKAEFGLMEDQIKALDGEMSIAAIDFSTLHSGVNEITVDSPEPEVGVLKNAPKGGFKVTVNVDGMADKKILCHTSSVAFDGIPEGNTVEAKRSGTFEVTVVGPAGTVNSLTEDSLEISAAVTSELIENGSAELPLSIKIKNDESSWVFGSYSVDAVISSYQ